MNNLREACRSETSPSNCGRFFFLDPLDHWITEEMRFGAGARYTDDFLIFADDKAVLHELHADIESHLTALRLERAENESWLIATSEGVPFCGFAFRPGMRSAGKGTRWG